MSRKSEQTDPRLRQFGRPACFAGASGFPLYGVS
jgi:hypothetical protein